MSDSMGRQSALGAQGNLSSLTMAEQPSARAFSAEVDTGSAKKMLELEGVSSGVHRSGGERRRMDALTGAAVGFFLLAVGFTAWVALHSSPVLLATLMLLAGLAGVACLGLFVLRGSAEATTTPEMSAERLLCTLREGAGLD